MNSNELKVALVRKMVNQTLYSLDGPAHESESYSLLRDGNRWKVSYKERGVFYDIKSDLSEEEACDLIYKMFMEMFCWVD